MVMYHSKLVTLWYEFWLQMKMMRWMISARYCGSSTAEGGGNDADGSPSASFAGTRCATKRLTISTKFLRLTYVMQNWVQAHDMSISISYALTMPTTISRALKRMLKSASSMHSMIKSRCSATSLGCVSNNLPIANSPMYFTAVEGGERLVSRQCN